MRNRAVPFALLALGGLLGLVASARPWWRASGGGADVTFPGAEATGGLSQALTVVVLAGVLLALTLRVGGRRLLAGVLALAGLAMGVVGALRVPPSAAAVRTRARQVTLADQFAVHPTGWPWVYAASGVAVLAGSVLLAWAAGRWPVRTPRFARAQGQAAGSADLAADLADDPIATWRALDAGQDPTAEPVDSPTETGDPGARAPRTRDTMETKEAPD